MSDLENLHNIRQLIGEKRQPKHSSYLKALNDAIAPICPYNVGKRDRSLFFDRLRQIKDRSGKSIYAEGSAGYPAIINGENNDDGYFYRLVDAIKLFKFLQDITINVGLNPYLEKHTDVIFEDFLEEVSDQSGWLKLELFALPYENYKSPRLLTFWTGRKYDYRDVISDSLKSGLASDWFEEPVVILRCRVQDLVDSRVEIKVPTVLDAFTEPIFHPVEDNDISPPRHGRAINIANDPLVEGNEEFVIGEIPVHQIEFRLADRSDPLHTRKTNFDSHLWTRLSSYYTTL